MLQSFARASQIWSYIMQRCGVRTEEHGFYIADLFREIIGILRLPVRSPLNHRGDHGNCKKRDHRNSDRNLVAPNEFSTAIKEMIFTGGHRKSVQMSPDIF